MAGSVRFLWLNYGWMCGEAERAFSPPDRLICWEPFLYCDGQKHLGGAAKLL